MAAAQRLFDLMSYDSEMWIASLAAINKRPGNSDFDDEDAEDEETGIEQEELRVGNTASRDTDERSYVDDEE